jgi:hypothetical protein
MLITPLRKVPTESSQAGSPHILFMAAMSAAVLFDWCESLERKLNMFQKSRDADKKGETMTLPRQARTARTERSSAAHTRISQHVRTVKHTVYFQCTIQRQVILCT